MKYFYIIDEDPDMGRCLLIVSEKDYNAGYNASYTVPQEISDFLYELRLPEEMEGCYSIPRKIDYSVLRKTLNDFGMEEKKFIYYK
jgi:hypothetical protein